tara:strand:+ start:539 stop:1012 length:474 start_codon:yes stop_codon:yes gene_type:complete
MAFLDKKITDLEFISTPGDDDRVAIVNLGVTKQTSVGKLLQKVVAETGSFIENATVSQDVMTFTRADSTTFTATIESSSYAVTASYALNAENNYRENISGASTYTIIHNLNEQYPIVQTYDTSNNRMLIPDQVESLGVNSLQISYDTIFTGIIIVQK